MKKCQVCFLLIFFWWNAFGQATNEDVSIKYQKEITEKDLLQHLGILASDEFEGRETGEKGQKKAAEYISNHFKAIGLKGITKNQENPYYQTFQLQKSYYSAYSLVNKKDTALLFRDFVPFGSFESAKKELDVVFAGYGIDTKTYSDYNGLEVKDKAVVIFSGEPVDKEGTFLLSGTDEPSTYSSTGEKLKVAAENGASFVIIVYESKSEFDKKIALYANYLKKPKYEFETGNQSGGFGLIYTYPEVAAKLLGTKKKKLQKAIAKINVGKTSSSFGSKVELNAEFKKEKINTENVMGLLEGVSSDETLVVTSHYDHVGIIDGKIHNGADDDGSGTTGLLEIAESFALAAKDGYKPKRNILFMTFTGEEKGLLGSKYYTDNPIIPLQNTIADLNIDMIGRVDDEHKEDQNYVYLIGSDKLSSELHEMSEKTSKEYFPEIKLDYKYNDENDPNRFYYRSDHYNFAKNNIPVIFYFNGTHKDYHQPTDTVEKINFEMLKKRSQLIFLTAWELANRKEKPLVDKSVD